MAKRDRELVTNEAREKADRVIRIAEVLARQASGQALTEGELAELQAAGRDLAGAVKDGLRDALADLIAKPKRRKGKR